MKAVFFVTALLLSASAQNDIEGLENIVHNGKDNHIRGHLNAINGYSNKILGNLNSIKGDSNTVQGLDNIVQGNDNLVIGEGNLVFGQQNQIADIQESPSLENEQWVESIQTEINQGFKKVSDQVKQLTEGMRRRILDKFQHKFSQEIKNKFHEKFHQQSKLSSLDLEKLKKMRPGNHRM